jgi:hypothetical protein
MIFKLKVSTCQMPVYSLVHAQPQLNGDKGDQKGGTSSRKGNRVRLGVDRMGKIGKIVEY